MMPKMVRSDLIMQTYMSQVSSITSTHCQAFNTHHLQHHKWAEDQPSTADQIEFVADENHHFDLK